MVDLARPTRWPRSRDTVDGREVYVGRITLARAACRPATTASRCGPPAAAQGRPRSSSRPLAALRGRFADDWRAFGIVAPLFVACTRRGVGGPATSATSTTSPSSPRPSRRAWSRPCRCWPASGPSRSRPARTCRSVAGSGTSAGSTSSGCRSWRGRPPHALACRRRAARASGARFADGSIVDGAAALAAKRAVLSELATAVRAVRPRPRGGSARLHAGAPRGRRVRPVPWGEPSASASIGEVAGPTSRRSVAAGTTSTPLRSAITPTSSGSRTSRWSSSRTVCRSAVRPSLSIYRSVCIPWATTSGAPRPVRGGDVDRCAARRVLRQRPDLGLPTSSSGSDPPRRPRPVPGRAGAPLRVAGLLAHRPRDGTATSVLDPRRRRSRSTAST